MTTERSAYFFRYCLCFGLFCAFLITGLFHTPDFAGWFVAGLSFLLLFTKKIIRNKYLFLALVLMLLAHHAVSIFNHYVYILPGANIDSTEFQNQITYIAHTKHFQWDVAKGFFHDFFSLLYFISTSQFYGQELCIFAFLIAMILLNHLMERVNEQMYAPLVILAFSFLPYVLAWTSVLLRESWELMALLSSIYFGLTYRLPNSSNPHVRLMISILSLLFLSMLHVTFTVLSPVLFILIVLWPLNQSLSDWLNKKLLYTAILILLFLLGAIFLILKSHAPSLQDAQFVYGGKLIQRIVNYRQYFTHCNTCYFIPFDASSFSGILLSFGKIFSYYLIGPYPWDVQTKLWFFIMLNSWLRTFCLVLALIASYQATGNTKKIYCLLLTIYFLLSLVWAVGGYNFGTELRHQITTEWITIMLALPFLAKWLKKMRNVLS